jgi:dipeptidyl aminopeptidase/acylaminoacyl peptidase
VVELRRADGKPLQVLSKANVDALLLAHWQSPEEFVVKAADGITDLYGALFKPHDFDSGRKYPVIDDIYAGPQWAAVPRAYLEGAPRRGLAQLGFIVLRLDGRGTPERGKRFQDAVYLNLGRNEIPDHVAALRQLAATRPYMDLERVGIVGHSYGGYFAIRALLTAPDVFKVGVASAPPTELLLDPVGIEPYLGLPQEHKDAYDFASNLPLAHNLRGRLLLIAGTSDVNVPFSETLRMVDALTRAGKPYDLVVLPARDHTIPGDAYWRTTVRRYLQEHLQP